jgi:hypothetical protein
MKSERILTHEFVEFIPDELKNGTIYVSVKYATVAHKCCCGCGNEVVTPLSPTDWKLVFNGESISLDPSIGNWSFECKSHYWIKRNRVKWAARWSQEEIAAGRASNRQAKERYFNNAETAAADSLTKEKEDIVGASKAERCLWQKLREWWLKGRG